MCSSLFFAFFLLLCVYSDESIPIVDTNYGKISGRYVGDVAVFTSIPYADKVDGKNRWKDARPPFPWPGIYDATIISPGCPQKCDLPSTKYTCPAIQDENCLYLNIFAPKNAKMLAVLVFFHGGEFVQGFGGAELYNGTFLVNKTDIILVTVNYRLHALGYLVYGSGEQAITGNYGLKDQILALEWVQSNVKFFGGDPGRVTISGQSAGAVSSSVLLTSVQSSGLFHQVIVQSNPIGVTLKPVADSVRLGKDFAKQLGCGTENDFDCLYSKNFSEVTEAAMAVNSAIVDPLHLYDIFLQWTPVVNGAEVIDQTLILIEKGIHPNMPILIGTTAEEGVLFVGKSYPGFMKKSKYDSLLFDFDPFHYFEVHEMYPPVDGDNSFICSVMGTDRAFLCPTRHAAQVYSNQTFDLHTAPVYLYVFNQSWSFKEAWKPGSGFCGNYSCHGAELPFLFGTISLAGYEFTADEAKLSNSVMYYWSNFVKYGNPNGFSAEQDEVEWPEYSSSDGWNMMKFKTPKNEVSEDYNKKFCDEWDQIGYDLH